MFVQLLANDHLAVYFFIILFCWYTLGSLEQIKCHKYSVPNLSTKNRISNTRRVFCNYTIGIKFICHDTMRFRLAFSRQSNNSARSLKKAAKEANGCNVMNARNENILAYTLIHTFVNMSQGDCRLRM